jgi:hypothetical protein
VRLVSGRQRRRLAAVAGLAAAVGLAVGWAAAPWAAADEVVFRVGDTALSEVAGLARDLDNAVWWLVPSGGGESTTVYGVDETGATTARLTYLAPSLDVSAVAWHAGALYVGDLGDPGQQRATVQVHGLPATDAAADKDVPHETWELVYPDGPHDAQALLIDPAGRLVVVTADLDAGLYGAPAELDREGPNPLVRLGDAPSGVTDGFYLSDELIVLRTDTAVFTLDAATYGVIAEAPVDTPGGGVALSADGTGLVVSGQGPGAAVAAVPVPVRLAAPSPAADSPEGEETAASATDLSRSGTFIMLGAAAVLALGAGLLVYLRR